MSEITDVEEMREVATELADLLTRIAATAVDVLGTADDAPAHQDATADLAGCEHEAAALLARSDVAAITSRGRLEADRDAAATGCCSVCHGEKRVLVAAASKWGDRASRHKFLPCPYCAGTGWARIERRL